LGTDCANAAHLAVVPVCILKFHESRSRVPAVSQSAQEGCSFFFNIGWLHFSVFDLCPIVLIRTCRSCTTGEIGLSFNIHKFKPVAGGGCRRYRAAASVDRRGSK
jgi:hypothetical protein